MRVREMFHWRRLAVLWVLAMLVASVVFKGAELVIGPGTALSLVGFVLGYGGGTLAVLGSLR